MKLIPLSKELMSISEFGIDLHPVQRTRCITKLFFPGLYSKGRMAILHLRTSVPYKKGRVIYLPKCSNQNIEDTEACVATQIMQVLTFHFVCSSEKLSIDLN